MKPVFNLHHLIPPPCPSPCSTNGGQTAPIVYIDIAAKVSKQKITYASFRFFHPTERPSPFITSSPTPVTNMYSYDHQHVFLRPLSTTYVCIQVLSFLAALVHPTLKCSPVQPRVILPSSYHIRVAASTACSYLPTVALFATVAL